MAVRHEYIWGTEDWLYQKDGILIKLISAKDKLSVQVHPTDEYAALQGLVSGKSECWYVLEAVPGSIVYCGLKKDVSAEDFEDSIAGNLFNPELYLNKIELSGGDFIWIPAGTVHALSGGIKILEIQQDSNITYRLYDYGRLGKDGKPRPLHIKEAIECIKSAEPETLSSAGPANLPFSCPYFSVRCTFGLDSRKKDLIEVLQVDKVVFSFSLNNDI